MRPRYTVDVVVRPEYRMSYEQWEDVTFAHSLVFRWSSRIARQYRSDLETIHRLLDRPLYVVDDPQHINLPKFLTAFDFHPCGRVLSGGGIERDIYERTLDGKHFRRWVPNHLQ